MGNKERDQSQVAQNGSSGRMERNLYEKKQI